MPQFSRISRHIEGVGFDTSLFVKALLACVFSLWVSGFTVSSSYAEPPTHLLSNHVPPYSMLVDGKPKGAFPDLVLELSRRINGPETIEYLPWVEEFNMTLEGDDYILFPLARTAEREHDFTWIINICEVNMALVSLKGQTGFNRERARDVPLIVTKEGTPMAYFLQQNGYDNYRLVKDSDMAAQMLHDGTADVWFTPIALALHLFKQNGFDTTSLVFGEVVLRSDLYVGGSKKLPAAVVQKWRDGFEQLVDDGTYIKILTQYLMRP